MVWGKGKPSSLLGEAQNSIVVKGGRWKKERRGYDKHSRAEAEGSQKGRRFLLDRLKSEGRVKKRTLRIYEERTIKV